MSEKLERYVNKDWEAEEARADRQGVTYELRGGCLWVA